MRNQLLQEKKFLENANLSSSVCLKVLKKILARIPFNQLLKGKRTAASILNESFWLHIHSAYSLPGKEH